MIGKSHVVLLALLLALPTAFLGAAVLTTQAQPTYTAWLKIVTSAWKGDTYLAIPAGTTFAERYNVTNVCVYVAHLKSQGNASDPILFAGSPNATGFIQISWPTSWQNVTVIVKAKTYQGECTGAGGLYDGIIVYWLTVNSTEPFKQRITGTRPYGTLPYGANATVNDDGIVDQWPDADLSGWRIQNDRGRAGLSSGPVDFLDHASPRGMDPAWFAGNFSTPANAWVARAAYIFKVFHEHTWYGADDVLTYATIFIYDVDHTAADSPQSLIQAAITGRDGQSRYTREIYPAKEGKGEFDSPPGRFADNRLVPIPLQTLNLANRTAFHGGIGAPQNTPPGDTFFRVGAPHLNATKRVWWETVLTNQTFYVGREYNGTGSTAPVAGKQRPNWGAFPASPTLSATVTQGGITGVAAGPLSMAFNHTITRSSGADGFDSWGGLTVNVTNVANFNNNTVFYARFCVQDADLNIQHPEVGDKMVGAEVTLNFKTRPSTPYYLSHNILDTDSGGCTDDPHKWPGYRTPQFSKYARFPNGTNWGLRGSLNASYHFNPADDTAGVWSPGGFFEKAWGGSWDGPYVNAGKNWSALIPEITYMKTRTLSDDKTWDGFDIQVKWKGGSRNGYGGTAVLVDEVRVRNPYAIAATNTTTYNGWKTPSVTPANNTVLIKIHDDELFTDLLGTGKNVRGPVTLMLSSMFAFNITLSDFNTATGEFDITISDFAAFGVTLYIVDNATKVSSLPSSPRSISDVRATIKFHTANRVPGKIAGLAFIGDGWADIGADGSIPENTGIEKANVTVRGEVGAAEVEIWPGPPGTGTIRALISANNTDILFNGATVYSDFVGAVLLAGTPASATFGMFNVSWKMVYQLQALAPHEAPDIALARTGLVYITAKVHDIAFILKDNMGNPLPAANTAVTLIRTNGPNVVKSGAGSDPDRLLGGLGWSYQMHGDGWAVFYQLPGEYAYDVVVTFDGTIVYDEPGFKIEKLEKTEIIPLYVNVYKLKLVFVDCEGALVKGRVGANIAAWVKYTDTAGNERISWIDESGALDFGTIPGGTITVKGLWWKGVWLTFDKATVGAEELPVRDGKVTITLDRNYDVPVKIRVPINNFIFTTWDYNMDNRIPRLNITLMWVGEHPLTGRRLFFLETLDPTGDAHGGAFNTSLSVQFLNYTVRYFEGEKSTSAGLKTYGKVEYVFYQMPSTYYNITVTTVTRGDPETQQTPGNSKWPGRTDAAVDYEIKIGFNFNDLTKPPTIIKSPAGYVNDRVVLRVFGTMGGRPVTDPNLNPIGNQTLYTTCGPVKIDLLTWAHTFYKRVVDGDWDYLRDARRIGNATFNIRNDNGGLMEEYYPDTGAFSTDFTSRWTSDLLDTTRLKATSQHSSNIWWNGSYRAENLRFLSYVYPLEFTRGEQPWAKFYDKVGLTGTGWETTERKTGTKISTDNFVVDRWFNLTSGIKANASWPTHNFTVVGNEGLWSQQKWRWEKWVAAAPSGTVRELPSRPYSLVFEKEVLTLPIPVGFITLNLKDEDLARAIPYAVVQLDLYNATDGSRTKLAGWKYKTGRDGNLTLLFPTKLMLDNILSTLPDGTSPATSDLLHNFTLTVYWYLNSSIVYKDAFNLTKRGYSVDKVAIADVTFVLAISADKGRPVKDLYAMIWWYNVSSPRSIPPPGQYDGRVFVHPGRITVDHAKKTWTYTAVPETRGAAKWTTGQLTLPWLPTSERFTKSDWDLRFDSATNRWVYRSVTRSWDIPYPSYDNGSMLAGWPYSPAPSGYYRALTHEENSRIQYRISVWSDQLPIDPASAAFGRGAWSRAAPESAARDHYELIWTRLSTGDTTQPIFHFAWMLFGHGVFNITWYRGSTGVGVFQPIPGYALTKTSERTPSEGSKVVAIKLNATDIEIPVFWQVGDLELGTYDCGPLVGYRVTGSVIPPRGATFPAITFDRTTSAGRIRVGDKVVDLCIVGKDVGLVSPGLRSGDTPSTVFWGGSTLRITAVAPPERIWADDREGQDGPDNPNRGTTSTYWSDYIKRAVDPITGKPVNLVTGDQLRIPGVDLGIQYMGYGTAFEGRPREHTVVAYSNDPDNRAHRPFIKMFEFQNVSARITDFNGRPLPGAFYQLVDAQTGKSAAWSYAGPDGRIIPMPIRKPGGVFIQRVLYLGQGANGEPTWPVNSFAKWPIAYDSRDDETTQETQKPDIPLGFAYTAEAGPWPDGPGWRGEVCRLAGDGVYNYVRATLEALASCPPSGWGRSFDVITRIFDLRVRFVYGDAQRPADPAYVFSAPSLGPLPDQFVIRGQGAIFEAKRLARGTYDIVALWPTAQGAEVGRRTFDVSRANVGTVEGTVVLALRDVSFTVVDRQGRPVSGARVSVSPELVRSDDVQLRPDGVFTLLRVPDGRTYDFTVEWTSPYGTTARAAVRETPAGLQSRGSITIPVDDVTITVVDFDGRPVAGADIGFAGQAVGKTDSQGVIIIAQVPLDNTYALTVTKDGTQIGSDNIRFTASRTSATLQAGIYDITVLVKGAAGQPIQGAIVELVRAGTTILTAATDASGTAVFSKVIGADYSVKATYEQFSSTASVARGVRSATITLDLYTVLLGVPMTFATFLALIIGLILLVIVVVVIVSEYIRWRGRRLGIYPAAPPKK